jgi:hypothetical protein
VPRMLEDEDIKRIVQELLERGIFREMVEHGFPTFVVNSESPKVLEELRELKRDVGALRDAANRPVGLCRFAEGGSGDEVYRLLTAPGGRAPALKELRTFLRGSERLTIVDPYILSAEWGSWKSSGLSGKELEAKVADYCEELKEVLGAKRDRIDVFHLEAPPPDVGNAVRKLLKQAAKHVRFFPTPKIHDRVWIRDGKEARVLGTSFAGVGLRKLAFMLELPATDLLEFLVHLDEIRANTPA